ncbi:unnamed protein product [Parnassius mnemosyne]|uniref:Integrase catalytic domain-containing protein n=1 Tax=Parnassius mnemosyne TaxID=213953 RepID=A0AAV1LAU7_9NEOP
MTLCLKKNSKVIHSSEFLESFNNCKQILTNAPILQYPNFDEPFILTTDASDVALGAVLSQGKIGSDKPVAYASRTLSDIEAKYSTIEKELLAIVWAVKYFRPYLYGRKFVIYTDHRPLTWLMSLKDPNSKLTRWRLKLAEYDYTVVYKKGRQNTNADALSRVKIYHKSIDSLAVNLDDNFDDDIINRIFENVRQEIDTETEGIQQPVDNNDDNSNINDNNVTVRPNVQPPLTDTESDSMSIVTRDPDHLVSTNHTQPDNENNGIPILSDAIDRQLKQFHIRSTPGSTYRVENRSTNSRTVIKDVFIPVNNTEKEIIQFLKEHTIADRVFYCYFYNEELYLAFSRVYTTVFSVLGIPYKIITDSDSKFDKEVIKEMCALHGIDIQFTTPYNPNSNSTIGEIIRIQRMTNKDDPIQLIMKFSVIAYNNSIHSATEYTPHELLFGHTASRNPLELHYPKQFYQDYVIKHKMHAEAVQECVSAHMAKNKEQVIAKRNQAAEEITFKVGETVYKQVAKTARNDKTKPVFKGPYKIIHLHPNNVAEIVGNHPNSKSIRVHFKLLRRPHLVPGQPSSEPSCSRQDPT